MSKEFQSLRIVYMGTPEFAVSPLQALHDAGHEIVAVYTQPPRPSGRGKKLKKSPVHEWAEAHDIAIYSPINLKKDAEAKQEFVQIGQGCDLGVVAAYGLILPQEVLDAPRHGCMNIHGSLLPRWRGAAPIQYSIWKGDQETGVTIMQMDIGLDTGDMLYKDAQDITQESTSASLYEELSQMGARLIVKAANDLAKGELSAAEKQDDTLSNYASMLKKEDGLIDWRMEAEEIDRQVRALNPWPGTYVLHDGQALKIKAGALSDIEHGEGNQAEHGTLLNKHGDVLCGDHTVYRLLFVQPAGKKAMDIASALNGGYIKIGEII
jgi:methionyl-tRNA formyltransferase